MYIFANVGNEAVIIDRVHHDPVISGSSITIYSFAMQAPIANTYQCIRAGDMHFCTFRFIALYVFAGIPNTCTQSLAGYTYPWAITFIFFPDKATIPWRAFGYYWFAVVKDFNFIIDIPIIILSWQIEKICISNFFGHIFFCMNPVSSLCVMGQCGKSKAVNC